MIVKEYNSTREDGVRLFRTYSDKNVYIVQNETGAEYMEAIDVENAPYTYSETEKAIESEVVLGELTVTANGTYECSNGTDIALVPGGLYEYKKVLPANVLKELFEKTTSDNKMLFGNVQTVATGIEKINDVYALEMIIFGGELIFIYATADTTLNLGDHVLAVSAGWNTCYLGDSAGTPSDPPLIRLPHDLTNVPVSFANLFGKQFDTNNEITMSSINTSETVTISNMGQFNKVDSFPKNTTKQNIALLSLMGYDEFDEIAEGNVQAIQNLIMIRYLAPSKLQTDIDGLKHLSLMGNPMLVYVDDSSKVQTTAGTVETGCWYVSYEISGSLLNSTWVQEKDPTDGYNKVTVDVKPNLQNIAVTTNGVYTCNEGFDGLGQVTVDIIKNLQNKTVTENGIYTCDEGFDGLGQVEVKFQSRTSFNDGKLSVHTVIGEDDLYLDTNNSTVEELIVNEGVTSIITTNLVSPTCPNLAKVFLPSTLQTIGSKVFNGCEKLSSINIPDRVTSIGNYAFEDCAFKNVVLPEGISEIGDYAFRNCLYLSSINLPNSITSIGRDSFSSCWELKEAILPNSLTIIEDSTFSGCSKLEKVSLPDTVTSIGKYAFSNCAFKEFNIPDGVSSIGEGAFSACTSLNSITIPSGVTLINNKTFSNCKFLSSISLPDSMTSIGSSAFYNCESLTSITIPNGVTSIGKNAFYGCSRLNSVYITDITAWCNISFDSNPLPAYNLYLNDELVTDLVIPDDVTSIGNYSFSYCNSLTSTTIPASVTSIGKNSFYKCENLTSITVDDGNSVYHSAGNCLIETATKILVVGCKNSTIPSDGSVTSIGVQAFQGCTGLTSIAIPDSVTNIGDYAFLGCTGLTSATIGNSVTSIGTQAFYACKGLTSITIPDSVTNIDMWAFKDCTGLTNITIGNSVTSMGVAVFSSCTGLTSISLPNSVTSISAATFSNCTGLTSITIPDSVTSIGNEAFMKCSSLTSITIPDSVTSIGNKAFHVCGDLTFVKFMGQPPTIQPNTFYNCNSVAKYDFRGATSIPTLSETTSLGHASGCQIVVPDSLYDSWQQATNWAALIDVVWVKASEYTEE